MTITQWRRHQMNNKAIIEVAKSSNNKKSPTLTKDRMAKKPMREIISPCLPIIVKPNKKYPMPNEDDEMMTFNFGLWIRG